jgi:hypothetical protein
MINLQKLSLVTLSAAILALVGSNAPAAAAQLFFNLSGNFRFQRVNPGPSSIYDEIDDGSFTGFFSIDSEEDDTNPAIGQGTYELSSWQIDLLTSSGDLVGQLTSADGGGSGEILVRVISQSPSTATLIRTFLIEFQDVLTGGTNVGLDTNLQLASRGFSCSLFSGCQQLLTFEEFLEFLNSPDNALPDVLPQEIIGNTSPISIGLSGISNRVTFANQSPPDGPFYIFAEISAVPPASVPEPGTATGLGLLALAGLLKKKVAFSPKTKATVKA